MAGERRRSVESVKVVRDRGPKKSRRTWGGGGSGREHEERGEGEGETREEMRRCGEVKREGRDDGWRCKHVRVECPGGFFGELRLGLGNELCTVHGDVHDVVVDLIEPLDVPTFTRTRAEIEGGRGAAVRG
jgi:hypothetical protein